MRTTTRSREVDNLNNVQGADLLSGYKPAQRDENVGSVSYYSFLDSSGDWYIQRDTPTANGSGTITISEFVKGITNYATNWTGRAGLTYATFDQVF